MRDVKAVILLSGGLDSSTALYQAKAEGYECYAISFDYQQRHRHELNAATAIAQAAGNIEHQIISFNLGLWGGSALTDRQIDLPADRSLAEMTQSIPVTYVPARNTIFLSFALSYAEAIAAERVYIGVNSLDYSGYPDCRPDYIQAMQTVFRLGTKQGREGQPITIETPLINLKKTEIIQLGDRLGVPWEKTWSCYAGGEILHKSRLRLRSGSRLSEVEGSMSSLPVACGVCDSCRLRLAAFAELGLKDSIPYTSNQEISATPKEKHVPA